MPVSRTALSEGVPTHGSFTREGRPSRRASVMSGWFYILRLRSSHLYCGSTHNLKKRLKEHFDGRACRSTTFDPPVSLIHSEEFPAYKEAYRREQQVKRWTRAKKEALISGNFDQLKRLAKRRRP